MGFLCFLLFGNLFVVSIIVEVQLDAKLVTDLVDTCTTRTDDTSNVLPIYVELSRLLEGQL